MARVVTAGRITPADELRALLADSELLLGNIKGQGAAMVRLLEHMDRISELWPQLSAAGMDLRPEAGRWETIQGLTHKRAAGIVRELRDAGGLPALRSRPEGGEPQAGVGLSWWWQLDHEVSERRRRRLVRFGAVAVIVVLVAAGAVFLLRWLYPVDPRVSRASELMASGQQQIEQDRNFQAALPDFQAAVQQTPGDAEPWLWVGVTQERLGNAAASQDAFRQARAVAGKDLDFYLSRAPIYLEANLLDAARADVDAALKLDPKNPQAYYQLSTIAELQGHIADAVKAAEQAGQYADERNLPQLVVASRFRLGMLLQRQQVAAPEVTATP